MPKPKGGGVKFTSPKVGAGGTKFLGQEPGDSSYPWKEWQLQAYITTQSHRSGYLFAAGMEGTFKGGAARAKAQATGQAAGEPDLRYYLPTGNLVMIELKTSSGRLGSSQLERLPRLRANGFNVCIVFGNSPVDAWNKVKRILECGIINEGEIK